VNSRAEHAIDDLRLSFNDAEIIPDPYPIYRALRAESPACFLPILDGTWLFFRYEDAENLLQDQRLSSDRASLPLRALGENQSAQFTDMAKILHRWVGMKDQPAHLPLRRHLDQVLGIFDRAELRRRIKPIVDNLIEKVPGGKSVDVIREICHPLPALVISHLFGLPVADHEKLAAWSDDLAYVFGSSTLDLADVQRAQDSTLAMNSYIRTMAHGAELPEDSLLHRLLHTRINGFSLSDDDVQAQCVQLLFAGLEPTRYAIGNAIHALTQYPQQLTLLRREPRWLNGAVEEFLRYDSPVQWVARIAREDFSYQNCAIGRGQLVLPYVAAANRDPDAYDGPEVLDVKRSFRHHLSFGAGFHRCLGMNLVREQMRLTLQALLLRFSHFDPDPGSAVRWNTNLGFHGQQSLNVRFTR
jgi:cytochrome P450